MPGKKYRYPKGFTLIEVLLVIGFTLLASVTVYFLYNKISESNTINNEVQDIQRIIVESNNVIKTKNNISLNNKFLSEYGIIDKKRLISNNNYNGFLSFPINFSSLTNSNLVTTHLRVTYANMNKQYCGKLIALYEPYADFISAGIKIVKNNLDPNNLIKFSMSEAMLACENASYPNDSFNMVIIFRLK